MEDEALAVEFPDPRALFGVAVLACIENDAVPGGDRDVGALVEFDYSGNPLISAPEWNLSGVAEYQLSLSSWGFLVPQYTASYRSKVYLDPQKLDAISEGGYWQHNARLSYRTLDGRYEISGWVENFTNERYKQDAFDLSLGQNTILEVWNDPRMYGLTVSAYF